MLKHYIITAIRQMQKYKAQNLISVVCLAVALLCFSICLYCTRYIYSIDECFEKKDRIVEFNIRQPEGRYISGTPIEKAGDMVVDAGLEKAQGGELLGSTWYRGSKSDDVCTVTGISEPFIVSTQHNPMFPGFAFVADEFNEYFGHCYVKCQPGQKDRSEASLRDFLRKRLPENIEITMPTLMDEILQGQAFEFVFRGIVGFMAIVAMVISLLGVYAAITLDTEYRRKEMAIRKVNGAGIRQIAWIFARLYVRLLVVSALFAFPIVAVVLHQIKSMYAFFIDTGVLFYGGIFVGVSAVVALTVGFRIHRIAKVNPAEIIRKE